MTMPLGVLNVGGPCRHPHGFAPMLYEKGHDQDDKERTFYILRLALCLDCGLTKNVGTPKPPADAT